MRVAHLLTNFWANRKTKITCQVGRHSNNASMLERTYECGIGNGLCVSVVFSFAHMNIARVWKERKQLIFRFFFSGPIERPAHVLHTYLPLVIFSLEQCATTFAWPFDRQQWANNFEWFAFCISLNLFFHTKRGANHKHDTVELFCVCRRSLVRSDLCSSLFTCKRRTKIRLDVNMTGKVNSFVSRCRFRLMSWFFFSAEIKLSPRFLVLCLWHFPNVTNFDFINKWKRNRESTLYDFRLRIQFWIRYRSALPSPLRDSV